MRLIFLTGLFYFNYVQSANILGVFIFPSISHQIVYQPIWRELSLKGHQVTVVTPDPLNDASLTNLTEISVKCAYEIWKQHRIEDYISVKKNVFSQLVGAYQLIDIFVEVELNSTQFKKLIGDKTKKFDIILIEFFHPVLYVLSEIFNASIIGLSPFGALTSVHDVVGNPTHPVLYPDMTIRLKNKEMTFWEKTESFLYNVWSRYHEKWILEPRTDKIANKYFENNYHVSKLEENVRFLLLNVNPLMYPPRPNVPALGEMGLIHIKPIKQLPKDLEKFLNEASEGVIYFSLGSNVKSVSLREDLRQIILEALSELPYKVIMKWESDHFPDKPPNVITKKWLPQQDLLGHPNIRAFVTQGGLQSIEEAILRSVPLVVMPFIAEQPMNMYKVVNLGIGIGVDPLTLTKDQLKSSINDVSRINSSYKKQIVKVRDLLFDKPMTGLEKAVWWTEYLIRHKESLHLKSLTVDISWFNYLMLDIVFTIIFTIILIIYLSHKVRNRYLR